MKLLPNTFTKYELEPTEYLEACKLTSYQLANIQNQISSIAEQKVNLIFDPEHPADFGIQNSYLQGQLDILMHQITAHEVAINESEPNRNINSEA